MAESLAQSLDELLTTASYKWIFVGGKGGVGKTTTSCSIAVDLSARRESVLILSTDPAHNVSDAFTQKFSNEPQLVTGFANLYAMELDSSYQTNSEFRLKQDEGWGKVLPELLSTFPGIDEALSYAELMQFVQSMKYDVVVFDTAPTGHTLRLLSFPDLLEKALAKLQDLKSRMSGALKMLNVVTSQDFNEEDIHAKLDGMRAVTTSVRMMLQDPSRTTFVCVCIPEFLSVYETERLVQELTKQNIDCSNVVVNQVLFPIDEEEPSIRDGESIEDVPSDIETLKKELVHCRQQLKQLQRKTNGLDKNFVCRRKIQSKYLSQIQDLYCDDFHVVSQPLLNEEVRGTPALTEFSSLLRKPRTIPIMH